MPEFFTIFYSELQRNYLFLPLIGFAVGLVATMIGSGGGSIFPLILIVFYKEPAQVAVATSLAASLPLCIAGSVENFRKKNIHLKLVLSFGLAGIAGALTGTYITRLLESEQLKIIFGIYIILLAIIILINNYWNRRTKNKKSKKEPGIQKHPRLVSIIFGFVGGLLSGTFGTNGSAPVLAGLIALGLPVKLVVGTSLGIVMINTGSAMTGHFIMGEVNLSLVLFLSLGTIFGAIAGPRLLSRINIEKWESKIKLIFAIIIIILGIIMIISNNGIISKKIL